MPFPDSPAETPPLRETFGVRWKEKVRLLKQDTYALYLASRHPQVPWYAKGLIGMVVAYALSPIDLIPDFIPILGQLDDLVLIPLGIALAIRLIPPEVMKKCRCHADEIVTKPTNRVAAVVIVLIWLVLLALAIRWIAGLWGR